MENFWGTATDNAGSIDWIKAGINDKLTFAGFSVKIDKNGNPMLLRTFYPEGGSLELGARSQYESFNLGVMTRTVAGKEVTESNYYKFALSLLHFLDAMVKRVVSAEILYETLPVINASNDDIQPTEAQLNAFVEDINPLVVGKKVRYKFVGEEKPSTKNPGQTVDVPALKVAYIPYAEALSPDAEKPVLAETKLKFDRTKKSDLKAMVPVAPDLESNSMFGGDSNPGF